MRHVLTKWAHELGQPNASVPRRRTSDGTRGHQRVVFRDHERELYIDVCVVDATDQGCGRTAHMTLERRRQQRRHPDAGLDHWWCHTSRNSNHGLGHWLQLSLCFLAHLEQPRTGHGFSMEVGTDASHHSCVTQASPPTPPHTSSNASSSADVSDTHRKTTSPPRKRPPRSRKCGGYDATLSKIRRPAATRATNIAWEVPRPDKDTQVCADTQQPNRRRSASPSRNAHRPRADICMPMQERLCRTAQNVVRTPTTINKMVHRWLKTIGKQSPRRPR